MVDNMPTLEELNFLYESKQYKNLYKDFLIRLNKEVGKRENDMFNLFFKLSFIQRRYMILNVDIKDVWHVIDENRERFLDYQNAVTEHFNDYEIDATYLIDKFCEFYLLYKGNDKRLFSYLIATKSNTSNNPRLYQEVIIEKYKQISIKT